MRDTTEREPDTPALPEPAGRPPGGWPSKTAALRAKWAAEHARRTAAYRAICEHLAEQPTPSSIRTVARRWCRDITAAADALATERQNQEHQA
ncbi:hypothetical protein [Streptomyces sp. GbtcB6]|uniref:hypothetical protein n=1 Tax=Streptomyces sp. GbtcB6 TaxID=2824751 RepID=UPI001C30BF35|nr:hypothetical protein [Streptomyces sp. GbtcB6]